jgi:hypothetical protein
VYSEQIAATTHRATQKLEREALEVWKDNYAGAEESIADALAAYVIEVATTLTRKPGGNGSVTVSVVSKRPGKSEIYYFPLQIRQNCVWVVRSKD